MIGLLARRRVRRDTEQQRRVLAVLILHDLLDLGGTSGYPLMRATGHGSAAVYVTLAKLERTGLVVSGWETPDPLPDGRPRRRLYRLTEQGRAHATAAVTRWLNGKEGR